MGKSLEEQLVEWGMRTKTGTLSRANPTSPRYGQRMSTKRGGTALPVHPLVIIDIHAAACGILAELKAYYVDGWVQKWRQGKPAGFKWKPDGRRRTTAHAARARLADHMGLAPEEIAEDETDRNKDVA